jgi:oxaloacetate decarboxylase alpha subunit
MKKPVQLTELVLRDAHQSLLATRLRLDDMLPIASELDQAGFWSVESWGGATFDACIRYLGEDPWDRLRQLKSVMPNTRQQMLLRGQNLLGYRHYADDVVEKFVERAHTNGVDVFRIFDAMNDIRNLQTAVKAAIQVGAHAQGTISYTVSPVHNIHMWLTMAKQLEDMGVHSICIKDMAGLLKPYECEELIYKLKASIDVPIAMQCHATTGLSTATYQKAIDAGIDMLDTAISSMSMTYGHTATETIVAMLENTERDTGIGLDNLVVIAEHFRAVRKKYAKFEGSLKGVDARILMAQVPGGMLTNMENQLKEQGAEDKFAEVLAEIPNVREDLGYIPLVTPTSQIVGSQAVLNVLSGERYKSISKETAGVLKGQYGTTPAPVNKQLQERVLAGEQPITCRPADNIEPELYALDQDLVQLAAEQKFSLAKNAIDDTLTFALFPQVGLKFLKNRGNAQAFEPAPITAPAVTSTLQPNSSTAAQQKVAQAYDVNVDGKIYQVQVAASGTLTGISTAAELTQHKPQALISSDDTSSLIAPLSGNIVKLLIGPGDSVNEGDLVMILEAMKMETEIRSAHQGRVKNIHVSEGETVQSGQLLMTVA